MYILHKGFPSERCSKPSKNQSWVFNNVLISGLRWYSIPMGKSNTNFNLNFNNSWFFLLKFNCLLFMIALEYTINQQLSILSQKKNSPVYLPSVQLMIHWILLQPKTQTFLLSYLHYHATSTQLFFVISLYIYAV